MSLVAFSPGMQVIDTRTGNLTRDGALLFQFLVDAVNGAGAVITADGEQTLTGKAISGNFNTLTDISADSLEQTTGNGDAVVTAAAAGTTNYVAIWSNGDLVDGPQAGTLLTTDTGVLVSGETDMEGPFKLARYAVADVPSAVDYYAGMIFVINEAGGATVAFSDGTNWLRVQDRAVIS